jgi:hypothetical protein
MQKIYLNEAAEILELKKYITKLEAEVTYFEKDMLSGDGHHCESCGRVRHVNDCDNIDGYYTCSPECTRKIEADIKADEESKNDAAWTYDNR